MRVSIVAALRGGTEEIAKFWYGKLDRDVPGDRGHGDLSQDLWSRFLRCRLQPENEGWGGSRGSRLLDRGAVWKGRNVREGNPSAEAVRRSNATEAKKKGSVTVILYVGL